MDTLPNGPLTRDEAIELMKSSDSPFATTTESIHGVDFEVFTYAQNDLREFFTFSNEHFAEREFLVYADERLTFGDVHKKAVTLSFALLDLGVQPGDRIAIAMRNYPEYCIIVEAIFSVGAVAVTLNSWWQEDELEYGIEDSGARFAFVDHERW